MTLEYAKLRISCVLKKYMNKESSNKNFDPENNYNRTKTLIGYTPRKETSPEIYNKLGFKSGLEIHQQLKTEKKLFCH